MPLGSTTKMDGCAAIYPIIDMVRTALNVTGQALVPVIVAKREGILDRSAYDAPTEELALATA